MLLDRGIELKSDALLQFVQKAVGGPSVPQEQELQAGALAVFAQHVRVAEQFGDAPDHRQHLVPAHERVEARAQIRLGREPAGNAQGEADLRLSANHASDRGQADIVDLRIRAPHAASGDRDFELARQVVELGIPRQQLRRFERQRRSIDDFVGIDTRDRASGHIAHDIAAGAGRVQAHLPESFEHFRQSFDRDPVQLDILPNGEVGDSVGVAGG